ncbi:MAG: PKD domain-containing protein [Bacteroidetes bacterium]|nr:PKD domain-containing protein [Bacteroidota bacterium]
MNLRLLSFLSLIPFLAFSQVDFNPSEECFGDQSNLLAVTTLPDTAITSWLWDLDDDGQFDDATGKEVNYIFSTAGSFPVSLKITSGQGDDSMTTPKNVIVNPLPDVNFHVDNLCSGSPAIYIDGSSISSGTIVQYLWDFNNDMVVDDTSGDTVTFTVGPPAVYVTRLTCISDKGCSAFTTKTTEVFDNPMAIFDFNRNCVGQETIFIDGSTTSGDSLKFLRWDFGDGTEIFSTQDQVHTYDVSGDYDVLLIAETVNNCTDSMSKTVTVADAPTLDTLSFSSDSVIIEGNSVTITATGTPTNMDYSWSTSDTGSSITVSTAGNYTVTGTTTEGCTVKRTTIIRVRSEEDPIPIQSEFMTPNGDGINDRLEFENLGAFTSCSLTVYNMWNDEVFSSGDYQNDWEGSDLEAGTYFYILKCDDKKEVGTINILR